MNDREDNRIAIIIETMLEYKQYYLRELRSEMAEVITTWVPREQLMMVPFGRYILHELSKNEEDEHSGFRKPFSGVMPVFTDYTLLFQMWLMLYRVQYYYLYYPHHSIVNRIIDTVQPTIEPQDINETIRLLFTLTRTDLMLEKTDIINTHTAYETTLYQE